MSNLNVKRYELKYYINVADYEYCRSVLSHLMKKDSYQKSRNGYFIRSLYFDDIYDTSVEEKLAGVEKRNKYRLRIYDFKQDWAKFERKAKYNDYVQKTTAIVTRKEAQKISRGNYDCLLKKNNQKLNSIYFDIKKKYIKPVVIVDYIRDVYMLDYNNIRVTFDKKIRYSEHNLELFNPNVKTVPLTPDDVMVMEIKFNNFLPKWFEKTIKLNSPIRSAVSKYCQSRLHVGDYSYI